MSTETLQTIKCVCVGDGAVGKTCMLNSYASNRFPTDYLSTIFEKIAVTITINGVPYTLSLIDTAGQEDYDRLRSLSYPQTDVILICFSVMSRKSFDNVRQKWLPEIAHCCNKTPFLLVGTQTDLRDDPTQQKMIVNKKFKPVTTEQGQRLARDLKVKYLECSALTQKGLKEVFNEAIILAIDRPQQPPRKRTCIII